MYDFVLSVSDSRPRPTKPDIAYGFGRSSFMDLLPRHVR